MKLTKLVTLYSWGNAQIAWSPDTAPQSGLIYLN